jgi:hypothetical protein
MMCAMRTFQEIVQVTGKGSIYQNAAVMLLYAAEKAPLLGFIKTMLSSTRLQSFPTQFGPS